ncbi:MAG: glycosyltransferase [Phaeodactylibacter sp.]|nr:glycosyltransferase [Phaeodactylibacter sp.]MCB9265385.1 glycosyltransferase [Lewinellaceae bacterium]MCB9288602.1 glycosyltransferase [Lewinellaceae bacterium]
MKILQLCKKFPYPLKDGESIAVASLSRSLHELGCEVSLLAMNTQKHFFSENGALPSEMSHYKEALKVPVDNRVTPGGAFLNLFSRESYHISRFVSSDFSSRLVQLLKANSYDLIQLETPYLAPYIPEIRRHSDALVSMRAHNVEHEIWNRIAENTAYFPKRWYLKHLAHKLFRYEKEQLQHYDILVAITQRDLDLFRKLGFQKKAVVAPIGIRPLDYQPDFDSFRRPLSLSFIGSMDWRPNLEGLQWFLGRVWKPLRKKYPALELHIAGRNTSESLKARLRGEHVIVHGEIPDAAEFINGHSLMVVPLLSGSGMRAKILEGMALGKVVLTTSLGLEGIAAQPGREVLVADSPKQFIEQIEYCLSQGPQLENIGRQAHSFVLSQYDSLSIARRLLEAYTAITVEVA